MQKEYGTVPAETKKGGADMRAMGMKIKPQAVGNGERSVKEGAKAGSGLRGDMKRAIGQLNKDHCGNGKGIGNGDY